jgi:hypothetical protein
VSTKIIQACRALVYRIPVGLPLHPCTAGSKAFANEFYDKQYKLHTKSIRFVHAGDPVPCAPPGYTSAGYLAWFQRQTIRASYQPTMRQFGNSIRWMPSGCGVNGKHHKSGSYFPVLAEMALQKCYIEVPDASFSVGPHCADFSGITAEALAYIDANKAYIVGSVQHKIASVQQAPLAGWHVSCMAHMFTIPELEFTHLLQIRFMSAATTWIDGSFLVGREQSSSDVIRCHLGDVATPKQRWNPEEADMLHMLYAGKLDLPH